MTELNLEFEVENPELPLEMDRIGLSFLKASAKNYSSEWFEELYTKKKSVIKTYSWSLFLPDARFGNERIRIRGNKFFISFSDANMAELLKFYNAFSLMKNKSHPMNKNSMKLVAITIKTVAPVRTPAMI